LSYLARFPFSKIKIDRQFIRNMTRDPAMRAIVKTIIALGKSLDVTITAEGWRRKSRRRSCAIGCPQVQGFSTAIRALPRRRTASRRTARRGRQGDADLIGAKQRSLRVPPVLISVYWQAHRD
jgi:predicted signal transduction protein with EAL and GGDEF domain